MREATGVWLRGDAALIDITGADRFTWLQGMISNDTTLLTSGSATRLPACILDATGHLLGVITLTLTPDFPDSVVMETPAAQRAALLDILDRYLITEDVEMAPLNLATVTLQGPGAGVIAADICDRIGIPYYAANHTGSGGFDWYAPTAISGELVRDAVLRGARQIGAETRDLLRIEAGIPQYSVDMDASVIALEAGLGPTHISLTKGCYVGQEIIARIDSRGHTNKALTGLVITGGSIPSSGDTISPAPSDMDPSPRETGPHHQRRRRDHPQWEAAQSRWAT